MQSEQRGLEPKIRAARRSEASVISSLALRSKAHWGYSNEFLQSCREELSYSATQIESEAYEFRVCEVEGRVAGFYALELLGARKAELEALFVEPEWIGRGIGRMLIEHAKKRAVDLGVAQLVIQGDPNAVNFYEAAGGVRSGQRESASIPGRFLPLFTILLQGPDQARP